MNGIAIIGPTTSGKTEIAYEVARRLNGEVINFDLTQTYKYFEISSGASDAHKENDVIKHLYCFLNPDENPLTPKQYVIKVIQTAKQILSRGKIPIIEGGAVKYFKSLFEENKKIMLFNPIFCVHREIDTVLKHAILKRVNAMIDEGLFLEIKRNLAKGYQNTKFMKESKVIVPAIAYLEGRISLSDMKKEIVYGTLELKKYQEQAFSRYPGLIRVVNKGISGSVKEIAERVKC